jgi:hypothetical protein
MAVNENFSLLLTIQVEFLKNMALVVVWAPFLDRFDTVSGKDRGLRNGRQREGER